MFPGRGPRHPRQTRTGNGGNGTPAGCTSRRVPQTQDGSRPQPGQPALHLSRLRPPLSLPSLFWMALSSQLIIRKKMGKWHFRFVTGPPSLYQYHQGTGNASNSSVTGKPLDLAVKEAESFVQRGAEVDPDVLPVAGDFDGLGEGLGVGFFELKVGPGA